MKSACRQESRPGGILPFLAVFLGLIAIGFSFGCKRTVTEGSLVLTQIPHGVRPRSGAGPDERYPEGSRVILALKTGETRLLSKGLAAAGGPVASPSGARVFFNGKDRSGVWQIYEADLSGRRPKIVTSMPGGAADAALLDERRIVFSSPVSGDSPSALYSQAVGGEPQRLTFGPRDAIEPTVLRDGRILYVSAWSRGASTNCHHGLFTINNDGTEVTPFALDGDGAPFVRRPREIGQGRIAFLASDISNAGRVVAEQVRLARPFQSRAGLFETSLSECGSIEAGDRGRLLACSGGAALQFEADGKGQGQPIFDDPAWSEVEAVSLWPRSAPMGHLSAMSAFKSTGTILCLDANFTRGAAQSELRAEKVRVIAGTPPRKLGEVSLQRDGSFMAEVPADTPIGFEALDAEGRVVRRLAPSIWVRPGENRACVGCHEPYNRSPRNTRPIAVTVPAVKLEAHAPSIARK